MDNNECIKILINVDDNITGDIILCNTTSYNKAKKEADITSSQKLSFSYGNKTYIKNIELDNLVPKTIK